HLGDSPGGRNMGAFAMAAEIEEQHIEAVCILQRRYRPQPYARCAIAVTDDHGGRAVGLRPELATEQRATGRLEGEWTLKRSWGLRGPHRHSPASGDLRWQVPLIQLLMRSGKLIYEAIRQGEYATGCGQTHQSQARRYRRQPVPGPGERAGVC